MPDSDSEPSTQSVEYLHSYANGPQIYENVRWVFRTFHAEFFIPCTPRRVFHSLHATPTETIESQYADAEIFPKMLLPWRR